MRRTPVLLFCLFLFFPARGDEVDLWSGVKLMNSVNLEEKFELSRLLSFDEPSLDLLKRAFYARHGRPQEEGIYREIFKRTSWYRVNPAYVNAMLTPGDVENIKRIHMITTYTRKEKVFAYACSKSGWLAESTYPQGVRIRFTRDRLKLQGSAFYNVLGKSKAVELSVPLENHGLRGWFFFEDKLYIFLEDLGLGPPTYDFFHVYLVCTVNRAVGILETGDIMEVFFETGEEPEGAMGFEPFWDALFACFWQEDRKVQE